MKNMKSFLLGSALAIITNIGLVGLSIAQNIVSIGVYPVIAPNGKVYNMQVYTTNNRSFFVDTGRARIPVGCYKTDGRSCVKWIVRRRAPGEY